MSDLEEEWLSNLFYRRCYWHASELAIQHRQDSRPEVWQSDPTEKILAEVLRQVTPIGEELDPARIELLCEAVDDAIAKRRPRW